MKRHMTSQPSFTKRQASVAGLCAVLAATAIFVIPKKARAGVFPKITQLALRLEMDVFGRLSGILGSAGWEMQPGTPRLPERTAARASSGETETKSMQLTQAMQLDLPDFFEASHGAEYHLAWRPFSSAGIYTSAIGDGPKGNRDTAGWAAAGYGRALTGADGFPAWGQAAGAGGGFGTPPSSAISAGTQKSGFDLNNLNGIRGLGQAMPASNSYTQASVNPARSFGSILTRKDVPRIANLSYSRSRDFGSNNAALINQTFAPPNNTARDARLMAPDQGRIDDLTTLAGMERPSSAAVPDASGLVQQAVRGGGLDTIGSSTPGGHVLDAQEGTAATSSTQFESGTLASLSGQTQSEGATIGSEQNAVETLLTNPSDLTAVAPPYPPLPTLSDPTPQTEEPNPAVTHTPSDVLQGQTSSGDSTASDQNISLADPTGSNADPPPVWRPTGRKDQRSADDPIATSEPSSIVFLGTMLILLTLVYKRRQKGKRQPVTAVDTGSGAALS